MSSPTPLCEGRTFGPARTSGECFFTCVPPRGDKGWVPVSTISPELGTVVSLALEPFAKGVGDLLLVFNDQDTHA